MLLLENLRKWSEKNRSYSKRRSRLSREWILWKCVERIRVSSIPFYPFLTTYLYVQYQQDSCSIRLQFLRLSSISIIQFVFQN